MFLRRLKYLSDAHKNQWLSDHDLKQLQLAKLKWIIQYAYKYSAFYREKFNAHGVMPQDLTCLDDIKKFPFTSKDDIRDNLPAVLTSKHNSKPHKTIYTSGSCGDALQITYCNRSWDYTCAVYARNLFAMGVRANDKIGFFWEPDPVFIKHTTSFYHKLGFLKKHWIVSTEQPEQQLKQLEIIRPDVLFGFPSSIKLLCRLILERHSHTTLAPRLVVSSYEVLSEQTRSYIETTLKAPVYNWYSSTEFMGMAGECKQREGLHLNADSILVETLSNGDTVYDTLGEVVVTGLEMECMPLIRYRLKDFGVLTKKKCSCGRSLPLLQSLEGRDDDYIILPSGKLVSPRSVAGTMDCAVLFNGQIKNFRVIQASQSAIEVQLVQGMNFSHSTPALVERLLAQLFNNEIDIKVHLVDDVEKNRRGKLRYVISSISKEV